MTAQLQFDDAAARAIESVYGTADVIEQRRRILDALGLRPGERVLDLGCGPGFLAAEMAVAVGPRGAVHGADLSAAMLEIAARRAPGPDAAPIELSRQDVLGLSLPDAAFDAAVCTQVYEYVDDMPAALAEARRVLVPGGRLLVLDTDWDSIVWRSDDDARMGRVLAAWDDHLAHRDLPRRLPELLADAGFTLRDSEVVPILNVGYSARTYSAGMIDLVAGFVAGRRGVDEREARAWADDLHAMGPRYFFSLSRYLFVATR